MLSRTEGWWRQLVPPHHVAHIAYFPDKVIVSFAAEPHFQHIAYAEPLILTGQQAPCALQLSPELHKTFLIILYVHYSK